jgi:hypothetical protein
MPAALGGATALLYDDYDNRSASGPAVTSAINAALGNKVMGGDGDDHAGRTSSSRWIPRVRRRGCGPTVQPHGANDRDRAVLRHPHQWNIGADSHRGGVSGERHDLREAVHDSGQVEARCRRRRGASDDTYDDLRRQVGHSAASSAASPGPGLCRRLHPCQPAGLHRLQPGAGIAASGWSSGHATGDRTSTVSFYFSRIALGKPVITGGQEYRWNIANCNTTIYHWRDPLTQEPGAMQGPTLQGAEDLIARDPARVWDTVKSKKVMGSAFGTKSPRVFPIPLYDPEIYDRRHAHGPRRRTW